MSEERKRQNKDYISVDISYLIRRIWRNSSVIVMCAIIVGIVGYIAMDVCVGDTYTASVDLIVLSRDNNASKQTDYNMENAITRNINVLNSDTLKDGIKKSDIVKNVEGIVEANQVIGTNLITLSATSNSSENTFCLLKAAVESYPKFAEYFESGYVIKKLGDFSADSIVKKESNSFVYALLIFIAVIFIGIIITIFITMFSDKIYSKEQAENLLSVEPLSVLHYVKKKKGQKGLLLSDSVTEVAFMEEIDKLTTRFQQKMEHHKFKVVMVSSIRENEGKTTLAANLALSLVKRGKKVLLMDGDLRKPSLVRLFEKNIDDGVSLSDFLGGKIELNEIMDRPQDKQDLICLWQKKAAPEADRLLDGDSLKKAIEKFRKHVDYVIIDTPPIGIVRDTEILAGIVEATLLSLKQSEERAAVVNDVVDILEEAGTTVLGCVINMAKGGDGVSKRSRYGKYYYGYGNRKNGDG